jgi:hypothetical protein
MRKKSDLRVKNYLLVFIDILLLLYSLKTYKILITDPGIKSIKKVQNAFEHGNGMVGFDIGFRFFLLPSNFSFMVDQREKNISILEKYHKKNKKRLI